MGGSGGREGAWPGRRGWRRRAPRSVWAMPIGGLGAGALDGRGHLHQAAGLAVTSTCGPGGDDVGGLAVAELARGLGVEDVVDAGRAAAQLGLGDLLQLQAGDRLEQPARLRRARPGRGRGGRRRGRRRSSRAGGAGATGPSSSRISETSRTRSANACARVGVRRVVGQQLGVLLHRRAAAGRVDHDVLDAGVLEGVDELAGEVLALRLAAVVHRQRAAAALRPRARRRRSPRPAAPARWRR